MRFKLEEVGLPAAHPPFPDVAISVPPFFHSVFDPFSSLYYESALVGKEMG